MPVRARRSLDASSTALTGLDLEEVDLHCAPGLALAGDPGLAASIAEPPAAALLLAIDPTPMG